MKYQEFGEPKPPKFPLIIDVRPEKTTNLNQSNHNQFQDILSNKIDTTEQTTETKTLTKQPISKELATSQALLQTSLLQQSMKHLPHHLIANTEFVNNSQNFENTKTTNFVNYAAAFQAGFNTQTIEDIKRKKKSTTDINTEKNKSDDSLENFQAKGTTYSHNLNLFTAINNMNPFKKEDTKNYTLFQQSSLNTLLNDNYLSPLRLLPKEDFKQTNTVIDNILKYTPTLKNTTDHYIDNTVNSFDIHSNYNSIEHEQSNNTYSWEDWTENESPFYLLKRYSDKKHFSKLLRQFTGKMEEQSRHIERIKQQESNINQTNTTLDILTQQMNELSKNMLKEINLNSNVLNDKTVLDSIKTQLEDMEEMATLIEQNNNSLDNESRQLFYYYQTEINNLTSRKELQQKNLDKYVNDKALSHTKKWVEEIETNLNQIGLKLPFAVFSEIAQDTFENMELNYEEPTNQTDIPKSTIFKQKMINDTSTHLNNTYFNQFNHNITVTPDMLKVDNIDYGNDVFNALSNQNIINKQGKIINFDPETMFYDFNLENNSENERIRTILKSAIQGPHSFNNYDQTVINSYQREDILITDPSGNQWDLNDLLTSIKSNNTTQIHNEATQIYNILFDMLTQMSGDNLSENGQLKPDLTQTDTKSILKVYPKASWKEYNNEISYIDEETNEPSIGEGWQTVDDNPLSLSFNSTKDANDFYTMILTTVLKLEPLVSSFNVNNQTNTKHYTKSGDITEEPLRVLIDNAGELSNNGIITEHSNEFRYDVDHIVDKAYFETKHWNQISSYLGNKIIYSIGKSIFEKTQINNIVKKKHRTKTEEYQERKKEWEEKKYQEKKSEAKAEARRKGSQKEILQKAEKRKQKQKKEMLAAIKKRAQERKAREKALLNAQKAKQNKKNSVKQKK